MGKNDIELKIDYVYLEYATEATKIRNLDEARKDFKFLKNEDVNKKFLYTATFTRNIQDEIIYASAITLFENAHDILNYSKMGTMAFRYAQEKQAFEYFERLKNLFMPAEKSIFLYKGVAVSQIEMDQKILAWACGLKKK